MGRCSGRDLCLLIGFERGREEGMREGGWGNAEGK